MTLSLYARCYGTITLSAILAILFGKLVLFGTDKGAAFGFFGVITVIVCTISAVLGVVALMLAIAEKQELAKQRIRQAGWLLVAGLLLTAYETLIA